MKKIDIESASIVSIGIACFALGFTLASLLSVVLL